MRCKKLVGQLVCGAAIGAIAMAPLAVRAQDAGATGTMGAGATMSSEPMMVSGTVVRYYTDRSGYVTAADVQTANGIQMVHFSPGMGQRLYTMAPTGGQVNVWVSPSSMGAGHWDVVGVGADRPNTFMTPYSVSAVDLLEAEPYILAGSKLTTVRGKLRGVITANNGEVLALVLDNATLGSAAMGGGQSTSANTVDGNMGGTTGGRMIVRVPREVRHISPGAMGTGRVTPLFRGSDVAAKGYVEAPRYGALSTFSNRLVANALVVNGHSVGALGVPMMPRDKNRPIFGGLDLDMPGGSASPEEMKAMQMGYTTYTSEGMMGGSGTMGGNVGTGTAGAGGVANQ